MANTDAGFRPANTVEKFLFEQLTGFTNGEVVCGSPGLLERVNEKAMLFQTDETNGIAPEGQRTKTYRFNNGRTEEID